MGQAEGNREARHAVGSEPIVREPEVSPEANVPLLELLIELSNPPLEHAAFDREAEVADPHIEQLFVRPARPDRLLSPARLWPCRPGGGFVCHA